MLPMTLPIIVTIVALLLVTLAAAGWGVDSRPTVRDDHQR